MGIRNLHPALLIAAALALAAPGRAADPPAHGASSPAHEAAHAGAAHADPHKPSVFSGGIGNAIITLIIFGVVVSVLGRYAWPQLLRVLEERERTIRSSLEDARRLKTDAEKMMADYQRKIDAARQEATAIVDEGRRDAAEVRRRMQEEARKESAEMIERARREIRLATDAAIKDLYDRTADLAVQVAAGIVRKSLNADDHRRLVDESLERMKSADAARKN